MCFSKPICLRKQVTCKFFGITAKYFVLLHEVKCVFGLNVQIKLAFQIFTMEKNSLLKPNLIRIFTFQLLQIKVSPVIFCLAKFKKSSQ